MSNDAIKKTKADQTSEAGKKRKLYRPPMVLIAAGISLVTLFFIWMKVISAGNAEFQSADMAYITRYALMLPFALLASVGTVFCALSSIFSRPWCALTAGILFAVAACTMFQWSYLVLVQCVLCFTVYAVDIVRDDVDMFN